MLDPNAVQPEKATSPRPDPSAGTPLASAAAPGGAGGVTEGDIPPEATGILGNDEQPLETPPEASEDAYIDGAEEDTSGQDVYSFDEAEAAGPDNVEGDGADGELDQPIDFEDAYSFDEAGTLEASVGFNASKELARKFAFVTSDYGIPEDALVEAYSSGSMDDVRTRVAEAVADEQATKAQNKLQELVTSGVEPTKELVEQAKTLSKVIDGSSYGLSNQQIFKVDKTTILEKKFAEKVLNTTHNVLPQSGRFWRTLNPLSEDRNQFLTGQEDNHLKSDNMRRLATNAQIVGIEAMAKQEIVREAIAQAAELSKQAGWFDTVQDFLGAAWSPAVIYHTRNMFKNKPTSDSILPGSNWEEQYAYLLSLPTEEFKRTIKEEVMDKLGVGNPMLTQQFLSGLILYTSSDKFMNNAFAVVDIVFDGGTLLSGTARLAAGVGRSVSNARTVSKIASEEKTIAEIFKEQGALGSIPTRSEVSEIVRPTATTIKANALGGPKLDVHNIASNASVEVAGKAEARELLIKGIVDPDGPGFPLANEKGWDKVFSAITPTAALDLNYTGRLTTTYTNNLTVSLKRALDVAKDNLSTADRVARLTEGQLEVATGAAQAEMKHLYQGITGNVVDMLTIKPHEAIANAAYVRTIMGKNGGLPFINEGEAVSAATRYGFAKGSARPFMEGNNMFLEHYFPIDETLTSVREALHKSTEGLTPQKLHHMWGLRHLRGSADKLPAHQIGNRLKASSLQARLEKSLKPLADEIDKISSKEASDLATIMRLDNEALPPGASSNSERGIYRETIQDLEDIYQSTFQRLPSEKEVGAYFAMKTSKDIEYVVNNLGVLRDLTRLGLQEVDMKVRIAGDAGSSEQITLKNIHAKHVKEIPWGEKENLGIVIHSDNNTLSHKFIHEDGAEAMVKDLVENDGYRILQIADPAGLGSASQLKKIVDHKQVNFVLTKSDYALHNLRFNQVAYRQGWHSMFTHEFMVKQEQVRQMSSGGPTPREINQYEGDTTVFGFRTKPEALKYQTAMENFRIAFNEDGQKVTPRLQKLADDTLPISADEFSRLAMHVDPDSGLTKLNPNAQFRVVGRGKNIGDEHLADLMKAYPGLTDTIRSKYNLMDGVNKKWSGNRDDFLKTVKEERNGSGDPVIKMVNAEENHPFDTFVSAMASMSRNYGFADYKTSHVEHWVEEFGDLFQGLSKEEVRLNPLFYIHNGVLKVDGVHADKLPTAEASRQALKQLLGTPDEAGMLKESVVNKTLGVIYENLGQSASNNAYKTMDWVDTVNPVKALRGLAFHPIIGMGNPKQLILNALYAGQAIVISPKQGAKAAMASMVTLPAKLNPAMMKHLTKNLAKFGVDPKVFLESHEAFMDVGRNIIEGDHSLIDAVTSTRSFGRGRAEKALDVGLLPFKYGENFSRTVGWHTAFFEWRAANPLKKRDPFSTNWIIARAEDINGRMSRSSNAPWQQGLLSVPTQFFSFTARQAELMMSSRLTPAERMRLLVMNGAVYGPLGALAGSQSIAGVASLGQLDIASTIKQMLYDEGFLSPGVDELGKRKDNSYLEEAFLSGAMGVLAKWANGGQSMSISETLSPQGSGKFANSLVDTKKGVLDVLFGVSGSKLKGFLESLDPFRAKFFGAMNDQEYSLTTEDYLRVAKNFQGFGNAWDGYQMIMTGKELSKRGDVVAEGTNALTGILKMVMGVSGSRAKDEFYARQNFIKSRTDKEKDFIKKATPDLRKMAVSTSTKEMELHYRNIMVLSKMYNLTPREENNIMRTVSSAKWFTSLPEQQRIKYLQLKEELENHKKNNNERVLTIHKGAQ